MKLRIHKSLNIEDNIVDVIKKFVVFCSKKLELKNPCIIKLLPKNNNEGISTGGYLPTTYTTSVRYEDRAVVDVLRTIAHELTHHKQDEKGELVGNIPNIGGVIEDTANAISGRLVKMFVDECDAKFIYKL